MKRGILLNLLIITILAALALLPIFVFWLTDTLASARGCELSIGTTEGPCGSLYTLAFVTGLFGQVTSPLVLLVLAAYLLGSGIYILVRWQASRKAGLPLAPVARGMFLSSAVVLGLGTLTALAIAGTNWYRVSLVPACKTLPPMAGSLTGASGRLALALKLPEPKDSLAQYRILEVSPQGEMLGTLSSLPGSTSPAWSPDGRQLAYIARPQNRDNWELVLSGPEGMETQTLLQGDLELGAPAFTPDGRALVFQRWLEASRNPDFELFTFTVADGILERLPGSDAFDGHPRPSPDGNTLLFVSRRDGSDDIYSMQIDGSGLRRLTYNPGVDIDPSWSPDGRWIVFASNRGSSAGKNNYNLFIMQADGTNQCQLTHSEGSEWRPVWSPDGQWIAYISLLESKAYLIRPDGSQNTPIDLELEIADLLSLDWAAAD